ncbi:fumarate reductase subunit FrdC [Edwardsiella piscicida]|uniref:Fumarate reductase subunit C n=5 Tax=Edwardsiella TaxID=635 RepID=A0A0H3DMM5_EDWTF|nr:MULTISPECIES: fumarate reductase subunit FrdC [Edwardsiella]ADM40414.1 Fumarate reductase subunit C [Edwardsiella tarda FL6-60]AKM46134.1 fumarate reductase [Edwardsiella sp. EA181011]AGH72425.1 fumarate reductase subunit C [Edwardsiella piscicida C07-087]AIJ08537.1 fumarate reductase subunit C protein [Edwardsiella anguillarum ET080813]AKR76594.1 fumarate reductase subunit FrdC [Edwardsiella sp. LADL05-105]
MTTSTKRKPYVRGMSSNWWQKLGFYKFYMLRESSALENVWFSIVLIYGVFSLKDGAAGWESFVAFLQNPLVLVLNIISLLLAVLHTKTWFELAPKAANIVVNDEKMGPAPIIKALWVVTIVATVVVLGLALL